MTFQFGEAIEATDGVEVIVEDGDFHRVALLKTHYAF
jgi:hypothetical protein